MPEGGLVQIGTWKVERALLQPTTLRNECAGGCRGFCCDRGATVSDQEVARALQHADEVQRQLRGEWPAPTWFDYLGDWDTDRQPPSVSYHTRLAEDPSRDRPQFEEDGRSCVFYRSDGRCALQELGVRRGEGPWAFKPFYCWLYPLTVAEGVVILAPNGRRWCFTDTGTPQGLLFEQCLAELTHLLGEEGVEQLRQQAVRAPGPTGSGGG